MPEPDIPAGFKVVEESNLRPAGSPIPPGFKRVEESNLRHISADFTPLFEESQKTTFPKERPADPSVVVSNEPGLTDRVITRFLGTDVEDPRELERIGSVALGAIAGAKAGASIGGVAGPIGFAAGTTIGGIGGAAAGAAVPEMTLEMMEFIGLLPEGAREERALSDEEMRRVVTGEALVETLFLGAGTAARTASRVAGRRLSGLSKATDVVAEAAARRGVDLPPTALGERGLGRMIVNVLGRFPFAGSKATAANVAAERALKEYSEELPERISRVVSETDLGNRIFENSRELFATVSKKFSERYDDLFLEAKRAGVTVTPKNATEAVTAVLREITERAPTQRKLVLEGAEVVEKDLPTAPAAAGKIVENFLKSDLTKLTDQSLAQMDELIAKIDQTISTAPDGLTGQVARLLSPIKGAAKSDIIQNMNGEGAEKMSRSLAALDADFTETMLFFFETSTAKQLMSVRRQGIKGVVTQSEAATRIPVDKLANIIIDVDSPQAIDELSRLVTPDTFQKVGAKVLSDSLEKAMTENAVGKTVMRPDRLEKILGLGAKPTGRGEAMQRLLSGTGVEVEELRTLTQIMRKMAQVPMPNVSTFIARRAGIAGYKSVVRGMLPFLALGGSAGAGGAIGGLTFILGGRGLVGAVSDPANARALSRVLKSESSRVQRRAAALILLRSGVSALEEAGELTQEGGEEPEDTAGRVRAQGMKSLSEGGKRVMEFGRELFRQLDL